MLGKVFGLLEMASVNLLYQTLLNQRGQSGLIKEL
jgi:hypothetical protein